MYVYRWHASARPMEHRISITVYVWKFKRLTNCVLLKSHTCFESSHFQTKNRSRGFEICDKIIRLFKLIRQQCTGTYLMNNEWVVSSVRRSHTIHHKYLYRYFTASFPFISEFSKFAPKFVIAPFFVYSFLIWYHSADNFNIFFFISNSRQV